MGLIIRNFIDGSGIDNTSIALSIEKFDYYEFIESPEWNNQILSLVNPDRIERRDSFTYISKNNKKVLLIRDEFREGIEEFIHDNYNSQLLILIFRNNRRITVETRHILTKNNIPLLELPTIKAENERAQIVINNNTINNYNQPQPKFFYDLLISMISSIISSFIMGLFK